MRGYREGADSDHNHDDHSFRADTLVFDRLQMLDALRRLVDREDGIAFQRLALSLLREAYGPILPHEPHNDLGRDAVLHFDGIKYAVCTSLTGTFDKIKSDLLRSVGTEPKQRDFLFVTLAKITNAKVTQLQTRAKNEIDCNLTILEQAWIVAEALRPSNAFAVAEILQISPSTRGPTPTIIVSDPSLLIAANDTNMIDLALTTTSAIAVVGEQPTENHDEQIFSFSLSSTEVARATSLPKGADPTVCAFRNEIYCCYVRREGKGISIYFGCLTKKPTAWTRIATNLTTLCGPPLLHRLKGCLAVTWVTKIGPTASTVRLIGGEGESLTAQPIVGIVKPFLSQLASPHIIDSEQDCYLINIGRTELDIYRIDDQSISLFVSRPHGAPDGFPARLTALAFSNRVLIVLDWPWRAMFSLVLNTTTGEFGEPALIASNGKFPHLALTRGRALLAWAGGRPVTADMLRDVGDPHALESIADTLFVTSITEIAARQTLELDEISDVDVWAPVWCAWLNEAGQVEKVYGPLVRKAKAHTFVKLEVVGDRGLLICREVEDVYCRWLTIHD